MRLVPSYEYSRPQLFVRVRGYGRGGWWGALLIPAAARLFYVAYRLPRAIGARTHSRDGTGRSRG